MILCIEVILKFSLLITNNLEHVSIINSNSIIFHCFYFYFFLSFFSILDLWTSSNGQAVNDKSGNEVDLASGGKDVPSPEVNHGVILRTMFKVMLEESPESHREKTGKHWSKWSPVELSPFLLFISWQFWNHQVEQAEEPEVVLICDDAVEKDEIERQETLAIEVGSIFNEVEGKEADIRIQGKTSHKVSEEWFGIGISCIVQINFIEYYCSRMSVVPSSQVIEVCLMQELISIQSVKVEHQAQEHSSWYKSKFKKIFEEMPPPVLLDWVELVHDQHW